MTLPHTNHQAQPPIKFQFKRKNTTSYKFKLKPTETPTPNYNKADQFRTFVDFCTKHHLPYFQFFDVDNWKGPVTKIDQSDLDTQLHLFDNAQDYLHTIVLNGYGFAIVKPIEHLDDSDIVYKDNYFDACKFTDEPIIPYNSDMEDETHVDSEVHSDSSQMDVEEEFISEEEFIAEDWTYDGTTYLLDRSTGYLYFPSTLEFIGKKTGEFSIDFNAKER